MPHQRAKADACFVCAVFSAPMLVLAPAHVVPQPFPPVLWKPLVQACMPMHAILVPVVCVQDLCAPRMAERHLPQPCLQAACALL